MRIGVFVCHCGSNIAQTVDVAEIAKRALGLKDVVHAENIMYTCSEPGQAAIQEAIRTKKLDRVVVSACSPHMRLRQRFSPGRSASPSLRQPEWVPVSTCLTESATCERP